MSDAARERAHELLGPGVGADACGRVMFDGHLALCDRLTSFIAEQAAERERLEARIAALSIDLTQAALQNEKAEAGIAEAGRLLENVLDGLIGPKVDRHKWYDARGSWLATYAGREDAMKSPAVGSAVVAILHGRPTCKNCKRVLAARKAKP